MRVRGHQSYRENTGGRSDNLRLAGVDLLLSNRCTYGRVTSL